MDETKEKYHVRLASDPNAWLSIPNSDRIFIDGGACIVYDADDCVIVAYSSKVWLDISHRDFLEHQLQSDD